MLLARRLTGVPVLVCADRYRAGRRAETDFNATVHLLDDGFQHVQLARDIDLLLVDEHDLADRVLPAGRLREPLTNAAAADAVIVPFAGGTARAIAERLGVREAFTLSRALGSMTMLSGHDQAPRPGSSVFAVAGIARPERFFNDLRAAGFTVAGSMPFPDHHVFRPGDIGQIVAAAHTAGASTIVTTEKDAVRLEGLDLSAMPCAAIALEARIEPEEAFAAWLAARLAQARAGRDRTRP
jgi:tetraacyldisaccharide 4'-kinase